MSLGPPEGNGPLRRERLRTARLYLCCDARPGGEDPEALLRAALGGGVDILQIREKELSRAEIERSAATFRRVCDTYSALFIVNDDPELAHACDADGVHVGKHEEVATARELLGPEAIVGLSTHSETEIAAAAELPIDYIAVGPVWETPTKPGRPAVGLELVTHAAANAVQPFFAIGGIGPLNAEQVVRAGARRLCVVRATRRRRGSAAARLRRRRGRSSRQPGRAARPAGTVEGRGARWLSSARSASSAAATR
jgi:thiamine-phosphate pyrophosphorylase